LNVALGAICGADFHVPFYPARDFHGLTALEFCGDVKTSERIVNPDAILSRVALHGGIVAGKCRGGGSCAHEEEEDSQSVSHVVSRSSASGACGASESSVANSACPEPKVRVPSLWFKALSLPDTRNPEQLYDWAENGQAKVRRCAY
jgi:hypothetical protein